MEALYETGYPRRVMEYPVLLRICQDLVLTDLSDVFKTYSGKTVEVFSTDAEGRNVLSDGLWKAGELDPEYIVDLATLTGAVIVALGNQISGMWSNNDDLARSLKSVQRKKWRASLEDAFE